MIRILEGTVRFSSSQFIPGFGETSSYELKDRSARAGEGVLVFEAPDGRTVMVPMTSIKSIIGRVDEPNTKASEPKPAQDGPGQGQENRGGGSKASRKRQ